jgi:CYTH domain-containing protein
MLRTLNGCKEVLIEQTYCENGIRLRKWTQGGEPVYIKTVKYKISDMTRLEKEEEISRDEYEHLILTANKECNTIKKSRYKYPFEGRILEIDVFPFWSKQAFLEIELEDEKATFKLPDFIEVIREVTTDKNYRNYALSKKIPEEEI